MKTRNIVSGVLAVVILGLVFYNAFIFFQPGDTNELFISTTTSVQNTGLLDYLVEEFQKATDYVMTYTAVGSGAAIQLARDGEVDAVLVHAKSLENELYADGYVLENATLWYNYFTIIGPENDPAGIRNAANASEAMALIKTAGESGLATFYSRGDNSGTHVKELSIWDSAGITVDPSADWYFETGAGMSTTIVTAEEDTKGYVLTDLGTYAVLKQEGTNLEKVPLLGSDPVLYNPYSYHVIDESVFDGIDLNTKAAKAFLDFLEDPETVQKVKDFTVGGQILFTPIGG